MEEWTKIIINANVPSTPLTPYAQPYQLEKHGSALDNEKVKKVGSIASLRILLASPCPCRSHARPRSHVLNLNIDSGIQAQAPHLQRGYRETSHRNLPSGRHLAQHGQVSSCLVGLFPSWNNLLIFSWQAQTAPVFNLASIVNHTARVY